MKLRYKLNENGPETVDWGQKSKEEMRKKIDELEITNSMLIGEKVELERRVKNLMILNKTLRSQNAN